MMSPLLLAATFGNSDCVRQLLSRDANLFTRDEEEQTPLHKAAGEGHLVGELFFIYENKFLCIIFEKM